MSKQNQDIDIQHDDEFEDFNVTFEKTNPDQNKHTDYMDDWDDDVEENFTAILAEQRKLVK